MTLIKPWTQLSKTVYRNGTVVTKRLLNGSGGGIAKHIQFPEGSKMYNLGIGSMDLYSFKGRPLTLDVYTAKAANGRAAGSSMFPYSGNLYEDAINTLRAYIKKHS